MGGLSFTHLILILVVILIFFGPSRLPTLGKSMGEAIRGFKKGLDGDEIDVQSRKTELNSGDTSSTAANSTQKTENKQS